jgi:hypothetical protein
MKLALSYGLRALVDCAAPLVALWVGWARRSEVAKFVTSA